MRIKLGAIAEVKTGYAQVAKAELDADFLAVNPATAAAIGLKSIVADGSIDLTRLDRVYTPQSETWGRRVAGSAVSLGDLIVAARGSSGKAGVITVVPSEPLLFTNNVLLVRPNPAEADADYLQAFIQSLYSSSNQETLRRGVLGQWSITRSDLEQLEIELPDLESQKKISAAFRAMHDARRAAQAVSDQFGFLLESLSKKFFRGELRT